jgi:hypothetical protein
VEQVADDNELALAGVHTRHNFCWDSVEAFAGFGAPTTAEMKPDDVARCQAALNAVKKLGLPREWSPEWKLG